MSKELKITYHNITELIPDPDNARLHDRRNIDAIKQSIQRFGIRKPIVVHEASKICYAGNGVLAAALELNIEEIPVAWIPADTSAEVAKAFAVFDNRTTDLSSFDPVKLDDLLAILPDVNLDSLLWTSEELDELLQSIETEDKEETFDVAEAMEEEAEPISKTGDIWLCGEHHRIMCGDSTKAEDVERLCKGEKADLMITDPPYNVGLDYGGNIDDDLPSKEYKIFLDKWWNLWAIKSTCQIITIGRRRFEEGFWNGLPLKALSAWIKTNALSRGSITQSACWEPIIFVGDGWFRKRPNDVFDFPIGCQKQIGTHPCPKPLTLWSELLDLCESDLVIDPFLGSGTTLIAAEKTGRICYGMEISPLYTDLCCKRYFEFTGIIPIKESDGVEFLCLI